ncbi:MAG: NAD(P)-dependent oxidoreductase [Tardiphaga sp.]
MTRPVIVSTHELHPRAAALLEAAGRLKVASALDAGTLVSESREASIIIVRATLPREIFAGDHRIKAAIRHGAGLDMIPIDAATEAGVLVANVPAVNARSVAEHVIFASLALLRRFRMMDADLRANGWLAGREHANATRELAGRTMGIIGMGAVGRQIAAIVYHGFGLTVLGNSRSGTDFPDFVTAATVDELVAKSDIVVLACPLTPETTGLMNRQRIAAMKPDALLINVSRGAVIDDDALIAALADNHIAGAALDVFTTQPLPPDHPYFGFGNVIVTPHMAGITEESMERMGVGAAEEALRVLAGGLPINLRNPQVLERYRTRFAV